MARFAPLMSPVFRNAIDSVRRELALYLGILRSPAFRELLWWCLPALAVGAIARLTLNIHFPYGYFQGDTPDFLMTAERFIKNHTIVIQGKKAFMAPILYALPFLLHLPALRVIPIAQHLAGLAATVLAGGIVRCWFRQWRWFIVPVTVLYTLNPGLLWFEHALLAECQYLFCVTALALAGTLLVRRPTLRRFVWLIVTLFFTAGSRPEGKLYVAFGLGVVALVYLGDWKLWVRRVGVMLVCAAGIWMCSRSTQAGLLLYATVLPLAPEHSKVAPGVEPYVVSLKNIGVSADDTVRTKLNSVEKHANAALRAYLKSVHKPDDDRHVSAFAQKLAVEAVRNKPQLLPSIAINKFLMTCRRNPDGTYMGTSGGYTAFWIYDKQLESLSGRKFSAPLMKGLTGHELKGKDEVNAYLHANFTPLSPDWFNTLQTIWNRMTLGFQWQSKGADRRLVPGWPAFFLLAELGMVLAMIPRDGMWRFHLPWVGAFLGVWFAVMLTGVVNARYRFVFEPFCLFYLFFVVDFLWSSVAGLGKVRRTSS